MGNMSYCRFENTLGDLKDCQRNLPQKNLSKSEAYAFRELIELCRDIAEFYSEYDEDELLEIALEDEEDEENAYYANED